MRVYSLSRMTLFVLFVTLAAPAVCLNTISGHLIQADPPTVSTVQNPSNTGSASELRTLADQPIRVRLENDEEESTIEVMAKALAALSPLIALLIAGIGWWLSNKAVDRQLGEKRAEEKRQREDAQQRINAEVIRRKLGSFYRPYLQLSDTNKLFHDTLKQRQADPDSFRTMTFLLRGYEFDTNDNALIEQIVVIGGKLSGLIAAESGRVHARQIHEKLSEAGQHFRILRLALKGALVGDATAFERNKVTVVFAPC